MRAFVPLKSAQLNAGVANARHAALDGAAPNVATSPAMKVQMKLRQAVNESAAVRGLAQLGQALNQRPSVVTQRINLDVLSRRSIVQRCTEVTEGKFSGKRSQYKQYVTGHDLSEMYARPGKDVERSKQTGETAVIDGLDYDIWEPSFEVIQDCVAAMEELMHGEKQKYGAPELSLFRDSAASPNFFGDSDDRNRELGKETDLGPSANPDIMNAFLIAQQQYKPMRLDRNSTAPRWSPRTVTIASRWRPQRRCQARSRNPAWLPCTTCTAAASRRLNRSSMPIKRNMAKTPRSPSSSLSKACPMRQSIRRQAIWWSTTYKAARGAKSSQLRCQCTY